MKDKLRQNRETFETPAKFRVRDRHPVFFLPRSRYAKYRQFFVRRNSIIKRMHSEDKEKRKLLG